ncbi:MAG: hypothetical protein K6A33_05030 [Clostridiales bacterium]|jgi:hypothetical protein|nr:hypothetical protein [Clostridiales bacterium]
MITAKDLKRAEKLLRDLPYMETALVYYDSLADTPLPHKDRRLLRAKQAGLRERIAAAERALSLLTPDERRVADSLFLSDTPGVDRCCAACEIEKSSVYRRRRRILEKVALAMWGGGKR